MTLFTPHPLRILAEGNLEEAVARRVALECGFFVDEVFGKQGWSYVQSRIRALNKAAAVVPHLALVDFMDVRPRPDCPASLVGEWLPDRHANMLFRVVVREIESWLLADREGVAKLLHVSMSRVPRLPEEEPDPKRTLVNLARHSRSRQVQEALVPNAGSTAQVGPDYNAFLEHFIVYVWNPTAARATTPSLDKCLRRLEELRARLGQE